MAQVPAASSNQGSRLAARRRHPLERLAEDFSTLFDRLPRAWLEPFDQEVGTMRLWDFDVNENDREIIVRAELPGFQEQELDVQLSNNSLIVKAEKEQKSDRQEEYRSFYRAVTLPPGIDAEKVQATYRNGVLEVHIPRAEGARPKRIQIQGQQGAMGQEEQRTSANQSGTARQADNQRQQANNQSGATASEKGKK